MRWLVLLSAMMFASTTSLPAQQKLTLTVEDAVKLGMENSTILLSSRMKVQYADAKFAETNAARLPRLHFGGSYSRLSEVAPFSIGPFPPIANDPITISPSLFNNYNIQLTLQQPLFTGFALQAGTAIADYTSQATAQDLKRDRADLTNDIQGAYWNLFKALEIKKVVDENVEQVTAQVKYIQTLIAEGIVNRIDLLKVEVEQSNARVRQLGAQNDVRLAELALNNLLGIPLDTPLEIIHSVESREKAYTDVHPLIERAIAQRPEIAGMEYRLKAGESAVTLARSGWFPQLYLTANYLSARPNQRIFPAQDRFMDTWDVSLSVSFDIWNWGTTTHRTDQAEAQRAETESALRQVRDGITLEVTQGFLNYHQSGERIALATKGVAQAEESYRVTNEKFKSGLALNTDLLDAEAALLQARWNYIQSLVDREIADAKLQRAIGGEAEVSHE